MNPGTTDRLEEIKARRGGLDGQVPFVRSHVVEPLKAHEDKKCTIGPLVHGYVATHAIVVGEHGEDVRDRAEFYSNAPTDIDWLIAEVERLRAERNPDAVEREG